MIRVLTIASVVWQEMLRKKDFYVLLVLLAALLLALLSLNAFGLGGVSGYVKEVGLLAAWILAWVLAVNLSCRQLPREERQGTIFPLLAKPISRAQLVIGKWLGAWTAVCLAAACFYALLWGVTWLRGGAFPADTLAQGYLLHGAALAVMTSLGVCLSTRLHADAAATLGYVLTATCFAVLPRLPALLLGTAGWHADLLLAVYYGLPHLELFDMRQRIVYEWGPMEPRLFAAVLAYGALWTTVCLLLAWLAYRRKRFVRGELL